MRFSPTLSSERTLALAWISRLGAFLARFIENLAKSTRSKKSSFNTCRWLDSYGFYQSKRLFYKLEIADFCVNAFCGLLMLAFFGFD